jgi:DNA-binding MarR family transcriptional regulator
MTVVDPLTVAEDVLWRALMRIVMVLPRRLDEDLLRAAGIGANQYLTLLSLSESPGGERRMSDLADATALSASRITRLVDELQVSGLVAKHASPEDGRGYVAKLTPSGLEKLDNAAGAYVSSVRALVFDHLDGATGTDAAHALAKIALRLDETREPIEEKPLLARRTRSG